MNQRPDFYDGSLVFVSETVVREKIWAEFPPETNKKAS
ncbi:unnamed protein product [Musa acuminata subsp. malaccensis]|uniref:(wild Malaysian banana) hypothetical protein n=1 Tax=Musa acuminata subsp. malaccensis TaxID=214687 RepID=A0A8D7FPS8_MUSAM|nr:unnamed protein product [Musa acuminata subsp. malaccensis]